MKLIKIETEKTIKEVIDSIKKKAKDYDFIIREVFDMAKQFKNHDVDVVENFEYYQIMICNPQKAYDSISKNKIRGAVLLPPKQIVIYKENEKTIIAYVAIEKKDVEEILPNDEQFQEGLSESCEKIVELMRKVK
jgi:uncharacterized protein (DUF302 family)